MSKIPEKMNLGELLNYAQNERLLTIHSNDCEEGCHVPYHSRVVSIGHFRMQSYSHDTGYSVRVYIVGAGKPYLMLNGTYRKNPSRYGFNPFSHESGAWDEEYQKSINYLKSVIITQFETSKVKKQQAADASKKQAALRKKEAESLFT